MSTGTSNFQEHKCQECHQTTVQTSLCCDLHTSLFKQCVRNLPWWISFFCIYKFPWNCCHVITLSVRCPKSEIWAVAELLLCFPGSGGHTSSCNNSPGCVRISIDPYFSLSWILVRWSTLVPIWAEWAFPFAFLGNANRTHYRSYLILG